MSQFEDYWKEIVPALWDVEQWDNQAIKTVARLAYNAGRDADSQRYFELIYAVGNKYPGETRHETALRYIRQAELFTGDIDGSSSTNANGV